MTNVGAAHNVTVLGSGETTVVLGHGFYSNQSVWRHFVPHLVDEYRVILYDDMGANTTDPNAFDFQRYSTVEGFVDDLISILEEFKVERCIFVGHSLSALAAALASISRPELFRKLIMINTTPRLTNAENYHGGMEAEKYDPQMAAMEENPTEMYERFAPLVTGCDPNSTAVHEYTQNVLSMKPDIRQHIICLLGRLDLRAWLGQVTIPCHVIQSSNDLLVPVAVAEYIHRSLGGKSVLEVVPTQGHLPHLSSPEVINPVLLRHIREDIVGEDKSEKIEMEV
ncbi:Probable esterase KAI2 [Striga hermonthica]|uniref:Probable esterase KAI2 n=1 Tax=Striga hermonthica TaxID=68872 RepID=A0A9N7R8M1_STRHE|nr:Probable esterase KAI2 [Striga hermonthica]